MVKILAFAGSLQTHSLNKLAAQELGKLAQEEGAEVTFIDLKDFPLPLFDQDIQNEGFPEQVRTLKQLFVSHDALIISSPEYNGGISGVLKNTLDWLSRQEGDEVAFAPFLNKVVLVASASPGKLGGLRGQFAIRRVLEDLKIMTLPEFVTIGDARNALPFSDETKEKWRPVVKKLIRVAQALH